MTWQTRYWLFASPTSILIFPGLRHIERTEEFINIVTDNFRNIILLCIIAFYSTSGFAEPRYCDPNTFSQFQVRSSASKPSKLKIFQIGKLKLATMAIGLSNVKDIVSVAQRLSNAGRNVNYCTWYFNNGNREATKALNWYDVPKPTGSNYAEMKNRWMSIMGAQFDSSSPSFLSCALDYNYLAFGCDGFKHRAPTVFAMILAYAGCSPKSSVLIANDIWGTNGIKTEMRISFAQEAAELASSHPEQSFLFRKIMEIK